MSLPAPANAQKYCRVSALEGGMLTSFAVKGAPLDSVIKTPCLAFLLVHSETEHKILFDLGIRKDWGKNPLSAVVFLKQHPENITVDDEVLDALAKGGTSPSAIDTICISHMHFDHTGDPAHFKSSTFVVGAETEALLKDGYPNNPASIVSSDLFPRDRTRYLPTNQWQPIGPFPRAYDFFGDESLYIVDAPGHFPGHINILARTSADGGWIYPTGDSIQFGDVFCPHENKAAAEGQIRQIRQLTNMPRVLLRMTSYGDNQDGDAFWDDRNLLNNA